MEDKTLDDVYQLLKERGAGENPSSQIRIWKFNDLFNSRTEFKNLQLIGKGTLGKVYLKKVDGISYAIKVMIQGKAKIQSKFLHDFYEEVNSLTIFRDERILSLCGVALDTSKEDDFIFCLIMNYMQRGNIYTIIKCKQLFLDEFDLNIKKQRKMKLIQQISEGLQVIHDANYTYKNLRP